MFLYSYSYCRLAALLGVGIALAEYWLPNSVPYATEIGVAAAVFGALLLGAALVFGARPGAGKLALEKNLPLALVVAFIVIGLGVALRQAQKLPPPPVALLAAEAYSGTLGAEQGNWRKGAWRTLAVDGLRLEGDTVWHAIEPSLLCRLYFDSTLGTRGDIEALAQCHYGDRLLVRGAPKAPTPDADPTKPQYAKFLLQKGVVLQHFIRPHGAQGGFELVAKGPSWHPFVLSEQLAAHAEATMMKYVGTGPEGAVALALTTGARGGIDAATNAAYAHAGTLHLLAVSGMHIGFLYGLLVWLAARLLPIRWLGQGIAHWPTRLGIVLLLWGFAFVAGLGASILRAVVMCTVLEIGRLGGRKAHPLQLLGAAAFLLMLHNPAVLFNLGFQLSFGALAGIFMFYQPLVDLYQGKSWLLRSGWQAASVTIAAQIGATPISLLYFGQFPTFFLLANVLASALGAISLYSCFALWLGAALPLVGSMVGKVLGWGIFAQMWLLNGLMRWIETLPFALLERISISAPACVLLLLLPTAIYEWLAWRKLESLWAACSLAATIGVWHGWHTLQILMAQ